MALRVRPWYMLVFSRVHVGPAFAPRTMLEARVTTVCSCGTETTSLRCVKCGITCCSSCSYALGSATCCTRCAESILDAQGAPLASPGPAVPPARWSLGANPTASTKPEGNSQWIILVARDQPDLFAHLAESFRNDNKVEVILDRRQDYRRNPPGIEERLRIHGVVVVKRPQR